MKRNDKSAELTLFEPPRAGPAAHGAQKNVEREAASRTAAIVQPCFFPWRGQFDLISRADVFVFFDTVQWVRRHWYNRNLIMGPSGPVWITVPVKTKGRYLGAISEIEIDEGQDWRRKLLSSLRHGYAKTPGFERLFPEIEAMIGRDWTRIADLAETSVRWGCGKLGVEVEFVRASELNVEADSPVERLVEICARVGADHYVSGPSAKDYITDDSPFRDRRIALSWMSYSYPPYPQQRSSPGAELSVLDLLLNNPDDAPTYIWPGGRP